MTILLLIVSELFYSFPKYSSRIMIDKKFFRMIALGCGVGFLATIVLQFFHLF